MLGPTEEERSARRRPSPFESLTRRTRGAFETLAEATHSLPRIDGGLAARLRRPIGRLVACAQHRDVFDQRIAHIGAAVERWPVLSADERAAAATVIALQLVDLSALLERAAGEAGAAFRAVLEEAERAEAGHAERAGPVGEVGRRGLRAAADLSAASDVVAAEAHAQAALVDPAIDAAAIRAADLGWMMALYTMDDERRVHRMAIARAGAG